MLRGHLFSRWLIPCFSAAIFFLAILFLIPYASGYSPTKKSLGMLVWILTDGNSGSDFSYCRFVPFVSAYVVYSNRKRLAAQPVEGRNSALALIFLGLLVFWLGVRAEMQYFGFLAVQILLAGIILWLWGRAVFRELFFPWAFLAFSWPLSVLDSFVAYPLRKLVSHLAYIVLNVIGVPTYQNGTALISAADRVAGLHLGERFQIDIADPCSGLRSLFALLMISALYSYFFMPRWWQQALVFLSAVPLTIAGNLVRILMLVFGCIFWGSAFAIGTGDQPSTYHEACGFGVYGVALGLEFLFGTVLVALHHRWSRNSPAKT